MYVQKDTKELKLKKQIVTRQGCGLAMKIPGKTPASHPNPGWVLALAAGPAQGGSWLWLLAPFLQIQSLGAAAWLK